MEETSCNSVSDMIFLLRFMGSMGENPKVSSTNGVWIMGGVKYQDVYTILRWLGSNEKNPEQLSTEELFGRNRSIEVRQKHKGAKLDSSYTSTWPMMVQDPNKQLNQYICISQNSIEFTSTVHRKEGYPTTPRKTDASTNDKESGGSLYQMMEGSQQIKKSQARYQEF